MVSLGSGFPYLIISVKSICSCLKSLKWGCVIQLLTSDSLSCLGSLLTQLLWSMQICLFLGPDWITSSSQPWGHVCGSSHHSDRRTGLSSPRTFSQESEFSISFTVVRKLLHQELPCPAHHYLSVKVVVFQCERKDVSLQCSSSAPQRFAANTSEFHQWYGSVSLPTCKSYQECLEEKRWWPFLQDGLPNKPLGGFYPLSTSAPSSQQSWGVTVRVLSGKQMPCRTFKWRVFNTSNWLHRCWKLKEQKEGLKIILTIGSSYNSQGWGNQRGDLCSPGPRSREEEPHIIGVRKWGRVMWLVIRFQRIRIQPALLPQKVRSRADGGAPSQRSATGRI